ncbi:MAG: oligosaccharide flippase family protein [Cryomorphaceae bacterium]|nr:oligosaccharide flippase family protein [Cryomorphaceae bacterium]
MTGTALGQLIALAFSVVVSRLYSPTEFATLEQFAMILGVLGVIAGARYEAAIMLPKSNTDARHLLALVMRIGFWFSLALTVVCFLAEDLIVSWLGNEGLKGLTWLIGPSVFFFIVTTGLGYWFSRQKQYKPVATGKTLFSVVSEPFKVLFAKFKLGGAGLVWSVGIAHFVAATYSWWRFTTITPEKFKGIDKKLMRSLAREYKDYPRYSMFGTLLNRLSQWSHIAIFGYLYGPAGLVSIGFLGLSRRIIMAPLSMLATSFSQVYFQRITEIDDADLKAYYLKSLWRFTLIGLAMIVFIWILPDNSMALVFGSEWYDVMQYLRILVFWFAANFTASALSFILHRIHRQKLIFQLDALHFVLILVALYAAWWSGLEPLEAMVVFVAAKVVYFIFNVLITLRFLSPEKL